VVPVGDINDKIMMAPKSVATLPRSVTENLSAIEEVNVARSADPNYRPALSPSEYDQKLQDFIAGRPEPPDTNVKGQPPLTDAEYAAHVEWLNQTLVDARAAGLAYEDAFRDSNGQWSTEREEYFEEIVDELYAELTVKKDGTTKPLDKKSLLLGGLPGAGKTSILMDAVGGAEALDDWVQVNSDIFKEKIAMRGDAPSIPGVGQLETADLIHKQSSRLALLLESRLIAEGYNVIFDGTMGGDPPPVSIPDLRQWGYSVDGIFVDVPIDTSLQRVQDRHRRGIDRLRNPDSDDTVGGRYVPSQIIEKNRVGDSTRNIINFNDLTGSMDRWASYDNTSRPPVLLDSSAEMPGGQVIGEAPAPAAPVAAAAGVFGDGSGTDQVAAALHGMVEGTTTFEDVQAAVANATFAVRKTEPTMDNHADLYEAFNSADPKTFEDTVVRAKYQRILTNDQVAQLQREARWEEAS
jgi:predicted ABC-type ATPase